MAFDDFDDYQKQALKTAIDSGHELTHRTLGLVGEAGEVAEIIKKLIRDYNGDLTKLDKQNMSKELGDVMWYVAALADHLGLKLSDIVEQNTTKLASRQKRGVLGGSGNDR